MKLPQYNNPVYINCNKKYGAQVSVELGYGSYNSSLFYVGGCGTDEYAALAVVVNYLVENNIIEPYLGDPDIIKEFPDDYIDVEGYCIPSTHVVTHILN